VSGPRREGVENEALVDVDMREMENNPYSCTVNHYTAWNIVA
jgi:hypothetical protein